MSGGRAQMENKGYNNQLRTIRMYIVNLKEQYGERNGSVVERFNIFSQCVILCGTVLVLA